MTGMDLDVWSNDDRNGSHNKPWSVCAFIFQKAKEVYDIFGFADFVCQLCFLVFVYLYGKLMFLDILMYVDFVNTDLGLNCIYSRC
jgi:hypothetical protein